MVVETSWVFLRRWRWDYSRKPTLGTCDKLKAVPRTRLVLISPDDSPQIWNRNGFGWNSGAKKSDLSWRPTNFLCILWSKFWKWVSKNLSKYWKQFRYLEFIVGALFIPKSWIFKAHFHSTSLFVYGVMRVKYVTKSLIIENRKIFLLRISKS